MNDLEQQFSLPRNTAALRTEKYKLYINILLLLSLLLLLLLLLLFLLLQVYRLWRHFVAMTTAM